MKGHVILLIIVAVVFSIIALPTYLCGCHSLVQPNCLRYYIATANVTSYRIDKNTCSECAQWTRTCTTNDGQESCSEYCSYYNYYDCYSSYVIMATNTSRDCEIPAAVANRNYDKALAVAQQMYFQGQILQLYVDKNTHTCYTESNVEALAITGLVFFCLVGGCLVLIAVSLIKARARTHK